MNAPDPSPGRILVTGGLTGIAAAVVTVNVIAPGIIRHPHSHQQSQDRMAPRVPLGRSGTVDDVCGAIDLLLSEAGAYVTGDVWTIDGGLSL